MRARSDADPPSSIRRTRGLAAHLQCASGGGSRPCDGIVTSASSTSGSSGRTLRATRLKPETGFGAVVDLAATVSSSPNSDPASALLSDPELADSLRDLWYNSGGFVVLRGLHDLTPEQLVELSRLVGEVEGDAVCENGLF
jgi:hypothetical protein